MHPQSPTQHHPRTPWKAELKNLLTSPAELCEVLGLNRADAEAIQAACVGFPLRVPRPYLGRIHAGDPRDPLLLQVLPQAAELMEAPGYSADPLQEADFSPVQGLLHKYHGRVLLVLTGSCAIHCRYCFRRHFPYDEAQIGAAQWQGILDYIAADESIDEVIFSGGDPLNLTDKVLARRVAELEAIAHLKTLRIHTRQPVMIPARVDADMLAWVRNTRLQVVLVLHSNHAQEIDAEVQQALGRLRGAGVTLLNQSVLLRGVNDDAVTLATLSKRLFDCGVLPYYLHLLDAVQGAALFAVPRERAMEIKAELAALLPGYLLPRFAVEEPHVPHKTVV